MLRSIALPYATPVDPEAFTTWFNPLWSRQSRGAIRSITPLSDNSWRVIVRTNRHWPGHRAGQYVPVGIEIDGVRHLRPYSICSPSTPAGVAEIEFGIRHDPKGRVSTHIADLAASGDLVHLGTPAGDILAPPAGQRHPLLLLSAGSGITPIISILRELQQRHLRGLEVPAVVALHFSPTPSTTMFGAELESLDRRAPWLDLDIVHTATAVTRRSRRLDPGTLERRCPDWRDRDTAVCGPGDLIDFATTHWAGHDVSDRLHTEAFGPAPTTTSRTPTVDAATSQVSFATSRITTAARPESSLLTVAEDAGVMAPSGCRTGVCHTCTQHLRSGSALNTRTGRVCEAGEHIQLCSSVALSDLVIDL